MKLKLTAIISTFITLNAFALPMDWSGSLGFDTNSYSNFSKASNNCTDITLASGGPVKADNCERTAKFQTYVFKLRPSLIINDSATVFSELSVGSSRGGHFGDSGSTTRETNDPTGHYFYSSSNGESTLSINQLYAELYADVGLVRVGRFAKGFGTGAVLNKGTNTFDRSFSSYDGFEVDFKIGSFTATPYWAKVGGSKTTPNGNLDVKERGISAIYHNINSNMKLGILWASRIAEKNSDLYNAKKSSSANIVDFYVTKEWEKLKFAFEMPMIKGKFENMYDYNSKMDYNARAYIIETSYEASKKWTLGLNFGSVSGQDDSTSEYKAMTLHPNYKIAEILYAYNYRAFVTKNMDIHQVGVSNSNYLKTFANWNGNLWAWNMSMIMAKANETAKKNKNFYDHEIGKVVDGSASTKDQDNTIGTEFDISFDYRWNPNVTISGFGAYLKTGDYFKFNGTATENKIENVTAMGLRLGMNF